jgi:parallel beta-helix repeat protein
MKRKSMFIALVLGMGMTMVLGAGLLAVRAASYTVCTTGPPTCDYNSVQSAVDKAGDGDVIKVAAGTYTGINNKGGHPQVVYLDKSVTIRGGYTTTNWTTSDPDANPTTLDAQGGGRVLYITGNISPTIEGLRITGGDTAGLGGSGGGVYIRNATATLRDNTIFANVGGGGVFLDFSAAAISHNTVISNTGGGLFLWESDNATLTGNTISYNSGTGITLFGDNVLISGNTISFNISADWAGGVSLGGDNVTLIGNTISSNTAAGDAGGVWLADGDGIKLIGNTITFNTAGGGGGIHHPGTNSVYISGNIIANNTAGMGGGLVLNGETQLINNLIVDNQATICCGSGLHIAGSSPRLLHNTIARNTGAGGIGLSVLSNSSVIMTDNILVDQTVGINVQTGSTATLEATLWGSGAWANGTDWTGGGTIGTTVNLWGDPDFVDPDTGDYHIGPNSAAIDQGVDAGVTNDIDFHPRPYQAPDIGADEYWPPGALKFVYLPIVLR